MACFQAVRLALEGKEREKEMVARLLRDLSPELLTRDQVAFGFTRLLSAAEVGLSPPTGRTNEVPKITWSLL